MTAQEALKMVQGCGLNIEPHYHDEVLKVIEECVEKQIPIKPYYWGDGYDENGDLIYDNAECPNCGNNDFEYGINNWGCKFCPDCGQALDWGDNE